MRDRSAPLIAADLGGLAWDKMGGLLPAIVQDAGTAQVLMLGYMDQAALQATLESGYATFFSRSKGRLWQKGETSGNRLTVTAVHTDCDSDALLVLAVPEGPTCHLGTSSCFSEDGPQGIGFLEQLSRIVRQRAEAGGDESYTARLLRGDPARLAQKIGEEGVELALAAVTRDASGCAEEAADFLFHLAVLMEAKGFSWNEVTQVLRERHKAS